MPVTFSDFYGPTPPRMREGETARGDTQKGANRATKSGSANSANFWLGIVGALVLVRLLWEKAGK